MRQLFIWIFTVFVCLFKIWTLANKTELSDKIEFTKISQSKAQILFDTLANLDYIEFRYANNHCEDRAHAMSYELTQRGIQCGKAWIFVRGIFNHKYPKLLKVHDANKIKKNNLLSWKYHVAPVVMTNNGDTLVLDPSLCETPVTLKTWFNKMNVKGDLTLNDVFFLIRDWKYQTYPTKNKHARLFEEWRLDEGFKMTKSGLCEGKLCQQFLYENPTDSITRIKARSFNKLPKEFKKNKKECLKGYDF